MALLYSTDQKREDGLRNPEYDPPLGYYQLEPLFPGYSPGSDSAIDLGPVPNDQDEFERIFGPSEGISREPSESSTESVKRNRLSIGSATSFRSEVAPALTSNADMLHDVNARLLEEAALPRMDNLVMESTKPSPDGSAPSRTSQQQWPGPSDVVAPHLTMREPADLTNSSTPSPLEMGNIPRNRYLQGHMPLDYNGSVNAQTCHQTSEVPGYPSQSVSPSRPASQDAAPSPYAEMRSIREKQPSYYPQQRQNLDVMSFKKSTRVETALDIRLELSNVGNTWNHIHKIRLHPQHVTKHKHLQDLMATSPDVDTLQLQATAFSSVAMKVAERRLRLLADAGKVGKVLAAESTRSSPGVISTSGDERVQAHDGEPIRMCQLCNEREKKRLQRSFNEKKKKTEDLDIWLTEASQKVVVINNKPIMDCKRPSSYPSNSAAQLMNATSAPSPDGENDDQEDKGRKKVIKKPPLPPVKEGTIVVDISMRICCYCRHHKDPDGFHVIFNLLDAHRKVVAQAVTEPIMITDDHKERKGSISPIAPAPAPYPQRFSGQGMFGPGLAQDPPIPTQLPYQAAHLSHSSSTPDLPAAEHRFGFTRQQSSESFYRIPVFPGFPPLYNPSTFLATQLDTLPTAYPQFYGPSSDTRMSSRHQLQTLNRPHVAAPTPTPKSSRPASPSGPQGRQPKRRRGSTSGRVSSELRMTPINPTNNHALPSVEQPHMNSTNLHGLPTAEQPAPTAEHPQINRLDQHSTNDITTSNAGFPSVEVVVASINPRSGPIAGDTPVRITGSGFWLFRLGFRIFFNGHEAIDVVVRNDNVLYCATPRADDPGIVGVQVMAPSIHIPVRQHELARWFTYVGGIADGLDPTTTISVHSGAGQQAEANSNHAVAYPNQQGPSSASRHPGTGTCTGTSLSNGSFVSYQIKHRRHSSLSTMSDLDTPPSYEEVLKTEMMLHTVGAVLEKSMTTTSEIVKRKREVKGLGSDTKLWFFWTPLLVIVLSAMVYSNIYPIQKLLSSAMEYFGRRVFSSAVTA